MSTQQHMKFRISHPIKSAPIAFTSVFLIVASLGVYTVLTAKPNTSLHIRYDLSMRVVGGSEPVPLEQPQALWNKLKPSIINKQNNNLILGHSYEFEQSPAVLVLEISTQDPDRMESVIQTALRPHIDRHNRLHEMLADTLEARKQELNAENRLLLATLEKPNTSRGQQAGMAELYYGSLIKFLLAENREARADVERRMDPTAFFPSTYTINLEQQGAGRSGLVIMTLGVIALAAVMGLLGSLIAQSWKQNSRA